MPKHSVVNQPFPLIDARQKATGQVEFISDLRLPGMLWGKVVRSPVPHARIKRIETRRAEKFPGVRAVITAADTPSIPFGPFVPDWEILAREKLTFIGQEVAAVAAVDADTAEEAARLVEIEYEELPAALDFETAMEPGSPLVREGKERNIAYSFDVEQGDVEAGFRESDYLREETFYPSSAFHAYLEPNGAVVSFDPISGSYTMWASSQVPYKAWMLYQRGLGIAGDKLRFIQAPMGGAFGGKFENNIHLVAACLSRKAEKPVRLVSSMEEEFFAAPLRVPMKIRLKVGIKRDGTLTAKETEVVADNGARTHYGPAVLSTACYRVDNLYRIQNAKAKGRLIYTNTPSKGAMRGFGNPQMVLAFEGILDMLAEDAGLDPADLRLKNCLKGGETTLHGWVIGSCGLRECIEKARDASGWREKRGKKRGDGVKRRGIGLACCNHVSGLRSVWPDFDGSSAMVKVGPDGGITVFTGEVDFGQGYNTVAAQFAAEEMGMPLEAVKIAQVDGQTSILGIGSLASRGTMMGGSAVKRAAADAREKILRAAEEMLGKPAGSLKIAGGLFVEPSREEVVGNFQGIMARLINRQAGQPFVGIGHFLADTVLPDPKTKYGNVSLAYSFGAHIAEVEVDLETGQVEVVNYVAANDLGKAMNPLMAKGQLEGAALQGIGWALTENLIVKEGRIVFPNLLDYKIPTFADMVPMHPILVEAEDPNGPYGAKSLGEAAFNSVAAAVCNAIYDAVGVRITRLPVTAESLLKAVRGKEGRKS